MSTKDRATTGTRTAGTATDDGLTIRRSREDDAIAIERLAQLDSQRAPSGDLLLAEAGGRLVAAVAVVGSQTIADPFRRTDDIIRLLRVALDQRNPRRSRSWVRASGAPDPALQV